MTEKQVGQSFEDQLRAMLRDRAASVHPQRPEWDTLVAAHRSRAPRGSDAPRRLARAGYALTGAGWRPGVRPMAAAASVLVVVLVGAVLLARDSSSPTIGDGEAPEDQPGRAGAPVGQLLTPAPNAENFDPLAAAPIYPVIDESDIHTLTMLDLQHHAEPRAVAREYLAEVGIGAGDGPIHDVNVDFPEDGTADRLAELDTVAVAWSTWTQHEPLASGHIIFRRSPVVDENGMTRRPWIAVGARTDGIGLRSVERDGNALSFEVFRDADDLEIEDLEVEVNGVRAEQPPPAPGESRVMTEQVAWDEAATIRVQHVSATPVSVAEMTVPPLTDEATEP